MDINERILYSRLLVMMNENPKQARKLGLKDISYSILPEDKKHKSHEQSHKTLIR